ncbi:unnamed protein product [Polarella glacialis]|uniref:EF-hand domain-containing protein n=1 Tax=Polarella glacialis TaxID=89957 RepID=A0A813KIU9_POLGL|nr:unnamed protein product [Polarella glacialis]
MALSSLASTPSLLSRAARRRARLKRSAALWSHAATQDLLGVLQGSAINSLLTSLSPSPCYGDSMLAPGSTPWNVEAASFVPGPALHPSEAAPGFSGCCRPRLPGATLLADHLPMILFVNETSISHAGLGTATLMPDPPLRQLDEPYWVWTSPSTGALKKLLHPASSEGEGLSPEDTFTRPERALQRIFGEAFEPPASSAGASMTQDFHDPFVNETVASHDGFGAAIPLPDSPLRQLDEPLWAWTPPSTGALLHQHPETSEEEEEFCHEDTSTHPERALQRIIGEAFSDLLSEEDIYGLLQPLFRPFGDGDGLLSVQELEDALLTIGICPVPQCWQIIMDEMDVDRSGNIDYTEFLAATIEARRFRVEEVLCSVFDVCDPNGEGKINMNDFKSIFEQNGLPSLLGSRTSEAIMKVDMKEVVLEAIEFFDLVRWALTGLDSAPGHSSPTG